MTNLVEKHALTPYAARLVVAFVLTLTFAIALNAMLFQARPTIGSDRSALSSPTADRNAAPPNAVVTGLGGAEASRPEHSIKTAGLPPVGTIGEEMKRWQERLRRLEAEAQAGATVEREARPAPASAASGAVDARALEPAVAHRLEAEPVTPPTQQTVRAVQRELTARGYDTGPVDGNIGVLTNAAILAYQHDEHLSLTGEPSEWLLRRIILGASGFESASDESPRADSQMAERLTKGVQQSLAALNYAPGPANGSLGEETVRAIREFEMDQGLVPTGRISGRLIVRLARASGKAFVLPVR